MQQQWHALRILSESTYRRHVAQEGEREQLVPIYHVVRGTDPLPPLRHLASARILNDFGSLGEHWAELVLSMSLEMLIMADSYCETLPALV
jgi:hypothetical protein